MGREINAFLTIYSGISFVIVSLFLSKWRAAVVVMVLALIAAAGFWIIG